MTILHKILHRQEQQNHATNAGSKMHLRLQNVYVNDTHTTGDPELVAKISDSPEIARLFSCTSQTEVPIAGTINGRFISRRIDRLLIDTQRKTIDILDYKTDTSRDTFHNIYITQIREYASLLHAIYPNYKITGYILWTHDFSLEKIPLKSL